MLGVTSAVMGVKTDTCVHRYSNKHAPTHPYAHTHKDLIITNRLSKVYVPDPAHLTQLPQSPNDHLDYTPMKSFVRQHPSSKTTYQVEQVSVLSCKKKVMDAK